jgi:hypothetical protein
VRRLTTCGHVNTFSPDIDSTDGSSNAHCFANGNMADTATKNSCKFTNIIPNPHADMYFLKKLHVNVILTIDSINVLPKINAFTVSVWMCDRSHVQL